MKKLMFLSIPVLLGAVAYSVKPAAAVCTGDDSSSFVLERDFAPSNESFASAGPADGNREFKVEFKIADIDAPAEAPDTEATTDDSSEQTNRNTAPVNERQFASREAYLDAIAYELNNCSN